jgi:hypothetical protein
MVQVDLPFTFGVGSLFASAVEQGLRSERADYFYQRGLAANLMFQVLVVIWLPIYLLVNQFGFQTSHMWWHGDSVTDYPWLLPLFIVSYFIASIAGYHTGVTLVRRGNARGARMIFVVAFVFFFGWMAVQPGRALVLGTYGEWKAGTARSIATDPDFIALLGGSLVLFFAVLLPLYRALRREAASASSDRVYR